MPLSCCARSRFSLAATLALGVVIGLAHAGGASSGAYASPLRAGDTSIADITEKVLPSVVNVSTTTTSSRRGPSLFDPFFNDPRSPGYDRPGPRQGQSLGSGVIVSADGLVLTNSHVIADAEDIRVSLSDGRELSASVVGADPKSDLAVLRLEGDLGRLRPIRIGSASELRLGEIVLAIGNPFGVGQTVTMGIVSAKGRSGMGIVDYEDFIQTDAAINPGNSGGALVNMKGELVGINTAILSRTGGYQGIGFAIPTDMATPIMESLIRDGKVDRGFLGVNIETVTRELAATEGMPDVRGVLVTRVIDQSPAARAGLEVGDIITRIDDKETRTAAHVVNAVGMAGSGKRVELRVLRDGHSHTIRVLLGDLDRARRE
ncbi:Do family serine endopeptidase [Haliangium sp.]